MKTLLAIHRITLITVINLTAMACRGGDDEPRGQCESITGGASQLTHSCVGCAVSNSQAAADGNVGTAAQATSTAGATTATATFRAKAQDGVVYPAGNAAGVFYTPGGTSCDTCGTTVSTYMNDVLQESRSGTNNSQYEGQGASHHTGFRATLQFNAVEIAHTTVVSPTVSSVVLQTFEICSNSAP